MTERAKHTPTPWWSSNEREILCTGATGRDLVICLTRNESDAEHIVRCVNAHDGLVAALREILGPLADIPMADYGGSEQRPQQPNLRVSGAAIGRARKALASLEGGAE